MLEFHSIFFSVSSLCFLCWATKAWIQGFHIREGYELPEVIYQRKRWDVRNPKYLARAEVQFNHIKELGADYVVLLKAEVLMHPLVQIQDLRTLAKAKMRFMVTRQKVSVYWIEKFLDLNISWAYWLTVLLQRYSIQIWCKLKCEFIFGIQGLISLGHSLGL